jgi:predicted amidophosphoribosyltransferase
MQRGPSREDTGMSIVTICALIPARHMHVAAGKVRKCRQCGTELSRTTKRCPTCGQPLSAARIG